MSASMEEKPETATLSPWPIMARLAFYAWVLSSIGVIIALAFIQSALRLSPAQLLEGLIGMILIFLPLIGLDLAAGYGLFRPLYRFLDQLKQNQPPSPEDALALDHHIFRFASLTSLVSAGLWYSGSAGVGVWSFFRADLSPLDVLAFVVAGAFLGSLTSIFNFFLIRRVLRPVHALLQPYLPQDDPRLLARPLTFRRKMTHSFAYLIFSILICMAFELYYFQRWAVIDQGLFEARQQAAAAELGPGRPATLSSSGFGFRVRLFAVDAAGQVQAGDLDPAESARLRESPYLLGASAFLESHPLRAKLIGWLHRVVLEPDHHIARVEGRTLAFLLPGAGAKDGRWGAVVEFLPRTNALRQYPSLFHFLLNYPASLLAVFIVFCLGFTALLTSLIIADVSGPLRRLQAAARSIQEGDLAARARLDTNDEIGLLILDFNRMADRLALKVRESESLVAALREATLHLGANTGRIVEIATNQATGATEQAASIQEVSSTSEEIAATLKLIAENARSVERVAGQTLLACRKGREDIGEIIGGMDRINARVRQIAEEMLGLQEHALKIESILDLIREVSEKTNLISLNASIEAAAAGESGRRFSIIAGEVRELAEQIAGSIREIQEMISLFQQATNRAIMVTEEGAKQVDVTHGVAGQVGHSFSNLTALAEETASAAKEISLSSTQQTSAGEHLAATIGEINEVARSFVESAREIESSTLELNRLAETLGRMVGPDGDRKPGEPDFVPSLSAIVSPAAKEDRHDQ